jgi:hypothetical protein
MAVPIRGHRWFAWPSRVALLLGIGALSAAGAEAAPNNQNEPPQTSDNLFSELRVWSEDGRVYLAEAGAAARELQLGDTAEARRLRTLLERHSGSQGGIRLDRMILAGGGGCGFDFSPPGQSADPARRTDAPASSALKRSSDGTQPVRPMSSAPSRRTAKDRSADKD